MACITSWTSRGCQGERTETAMHAVPVQKPNAKGNVTRGQLYLGTPTRVNAGMRRRSAWIAQGTECRTRGCAAAIARAAGRPNGQLVSCFVGVWPSRREDAWAQTQTQRERGFVRVVPLDPATFRAFQDECSGPRAGAVAMSPGECCDLAETRAVSVWASAHCWRRPQQTLHDRPPARAAATPGSPEAWQPI